MAEAEDYWVAIGEPPFPVLSDTQLTSLTNTPYSGTPLPGKILLSPDMEILGWDDGHGEDNWAWQPMVDHAAAQRE